MPDVAVTDPSIENVDPTLSVTAAPLSASESLLPLLLPPRTIAAPAVRITLPAAVTVLTVLATTVLLCVRLFAAARRIAPEPVAVRLALPSRTSRPELTLIAAVVTARPPLVAARLPLSTTSLAFPVLVSVITPLPALMPPFSLMPVTALSVAPPPAVSASLVTLPVLLVSTRLPAALAPKPLVLRFAPAVTPRLPDVAVTDPSIENVAPTLSVTAAPLSASESLLPLLLPPRTIAAPAVRSTLPAAVSVLMVLTTAVLLCVRLLAAFRRIAPEVNVRRLALPMLMSRPDTISIAFCVARRPALVACRLPPRMMSFAPRVARRIVPLVVSRPTLKAPRLRVRSTLPLGAKPPPVWLKSVATLIAPLPLKPPDERFTTPLLSVPLAISAPPLMASVPARFEMVPGSFKVMVPPLKTS